MLEGHLAWLGPFNGMQMQYSLSDWETGLNTGLIIISKWCQSFHASMKIMTCLLSSCPSSKLSSHTSHCRYENGEQEHCLELWNRDGKVCLSRILNADSSNIFSGSQVEWHSLLLRNIFRLWSLNKIKRLNFVKVQTKVTYYKNTQDVTKWIHLE